MVKLYKNFNIKNNHKNSLILIGNFDGVHLGHKSIFDKLNKLADENSLEIVLLTFSPHPRHVLFPQNQNLKLIKAKKIF